MGWTETCAMDERVRFVLAVERARRRWRRCAGASASAVRTATSGWRATRRKGWPGSPTARGRRSASAGAERRGGRALSCGAAGASDLGAGEGAGVSGASPARSAAAGGEHDRRAVRSRGADGEAAAAGGCRRRSAVRRLHGGQRGLVHRLQGLVPDRRRPALRAADAVRRAQPLSCCAARPWPKTDTAHVWPVLDAALREFGLPERLRSDNGPPFAACGAGGLSQLAVQGDQGGHRAGAHRARQAAAERPATSGCT